MEGQILTAIGTILGIAATLLLRDWRDGKNIFKQNIPPTQLDEGFKYMRHHYNDELTTILTELQVGQKEMMRDNREGFREITEALIRIESGGIKIKK